MNIEGSRKSVVVSSTEVYIAELTNCYMVAVVAMVARSSQLLRPVAMVAMVAMVAKFNQSIN